ncbi:hypothetical protein PAXRUDRAFT_830545, partial [Paxillus rubicundulus Ve08.2h10]
MDSDQGSDGDISENERPLNHLDTTNDPQFIQSSFDAYFHQASSRSRTSANVFSSRVLPLTQDEYNSAIRAYKARSPSQPKTRWTGPHDTRTAFCRYAHELEQGFNLLFYGFGSKRVVLNTFATECLATRGHVVVVDGFNPNATLKDILASIERVPGVTDATLPSSSTDAQIQRIYDFFSLSDAASPSSSRARARHLYLVIHNIDAPPMRTPKLKNCLALLALNPNIHLVASIDRLNAPLLWSTSEVLARKAAHFPSPSLAGDMRDGDDSERGKEAARLPGLSSTTLRRGYAFLWHDLTTLAAYDTELAFADRSSIAGASYASTGSRSALSSLTSGHGSGGAGAVQLTESAISHVLAAVTAKAKKLFTLLGARQLANIDAAPGDSPNDTGSAADTSHFGLTYDALFALAR